MKALLLAGGLGTRLGLKTKPKPMVKVNGKPVLEHIIDHLNKYGITEIIVKVHYKAEVIMKYFGTRVLYYFEPELLDVEESEKNLKDWLGDEYLICNGDTITDLDFRGLYRHKKNRARFMRFGRHGGTTYVNTKYQGQADIECNYGYWDIGTPAKLAKARRFFKNQL